MPDTATQNFASQKAQRGRRTNKRGRNGGPRSAPTPGAQAKTEGAPKANGAQAVEASSGEDPKEAEIDDSLVCWICAEPVKYYSVSECNHRTCHVCALRLRALYKKLDCTFCKESQPSVIFTVSADRPFSSYSPTDIPHKDFKLSIFFETPEMMEETLVLLRFNCPESTCEHVAQGWNDLKLHVRAVHGKLMCDLCLRTKKVFAHEHALYTPNQLAIHLPSIPHPHRKGAPPEQVEGGVHPLCEFCRECFSGDDELYKHMRERHEECFICKRNEIRDQYFKNYDALEKHFDHAHHPCPNSSCQARKFVVFGSLLDLQAHMVEEHGADMSSRDKKAASRINAAFEFQEVNGGRRRGAREREPPPGSQPPGPARSGNSRRDRFAGHLTVEGDANGSSPGPSRPASPPPADMDPATAEKYAALFARLRSVAPNPTNATAAVKLSLRSYRASESAARDLISAVWNILDCDLDNTASILNLLIDLMDDDDKKSSLLSAWNGFRIEQRRQFPDLVPTSVGTGYAGIASGRVLNAKALTAAHPSRQSSRAVWDRVAQAASASSSASSYSRPPDRFPVLQPSSAPPPNPGFRQPHRSTAWSASASGQPVPAPAAAPSSSTSSTPAPRPPPPPLLSKNVFPELPAAAPSRAKAAVGGHNGTLQKILGSSAPATPAWGSGSAGAPPPAGASAGAEAGWGAAETVGRKKGKGKQKQTLFTLGSFPT